MFSQWGTKCGGAFLVCAIATGLVLPLAGAQEVRPPADFIGHPVGADYRLAPWETIVAYFQHVSGNSARVNTREIGRTTEGRPFIFAEISEDATEAGLSKVRATQRKIADPRLIEDDAEARELIEESKVVVFVNCNLHSTEIASSQMAMELLYDLATGDSPRVREILSRVVVLLVPSANPDGQQMVVDWYRRSLGTPWEGGGMPWIYQKYAGHDNNRDWFMLNLKETRLETEVLFKEWFPTILYDVHEMGNLGARLFVPPFHDPKNPNIHPLLEQSMLLIGGHMAAELAEAGKRGVVWGSSYDNWAPGRIRTTPYGHNMVGLLTESASANIASPVFQRKSQLRGARRGMPDYAMNVNFPDPWPGGWWRMRDIVEYQKIAAMSLFTLAARYHDSFQRNYIRLGRDAIERGETEPPFAWIVPPDQRDAHNAVEMLERLQATSVEVHRANKPFTADRVEYPAGSYILYTAQPYRNYLTDMMERQVYPDREMYPGGPPEPPYDVAGWTFPLQMGVQSVEVVHPFEADDTRVDRIRVPRVARPAIPDAAHYVVPAQQNDDYRLANRLYSRGLAIGLYSGHTDWELNGEMVPPGSFVIRNGAAFRDAAADILEGLSTSPIGVTSLGSDVIEALKPMTQPRVAVYQPWTASMDEGWTRYVLEAFEFAYTTLHNGEIRSGNLTSRYDCIVLPSLSTRSIVEGRPADTTEPKYVGGIGAEGVVNLQDFVNHGGTLVCIDASTNLPIDRFNIPVKNVLAGKGPQQFYCPGSILRASVRTGHPLGYGMPSSIGAYFVRSQAYELLAPGEDSTTVAAGPAIPAVTYSNTVLLESGWIRGEELITGKPAVVDVKYGNGHVVLLGFRVQHRAQPYGTFRLLFNAIQRSTL